MVRLSDFTRWEVHSEVEYRLSTRKGVSEGLILDLSSAESTTAVKATGPKKSRGKQLLLLYRNISLSGNSLDL